MLVPVLAALAGPGKPSDLYILGVNRRGVNDLTSRAQDCDGHCAGMDPTALFCRRDSLNPVPARLMLQRVNATAFRLYCDLMVAAACLTFKRAAGLSSLLQAKPLKRYG